MTSWPLTSKLLSDIQPPKGDKQETAKKTFPVINPFNGQIIAHVPDRDLEEIRKNIRVANKAQKEWNKIPAAERADLLKKWYRLQIDNAEDLALILTAEQGKPLDEAIGEIKYGASFVEWFAEEAKRLYGDVVPSPMRNTRILTLRQPVGVVAAITPWNFPNAMITRKAAPALAAGCSIVLKPDEKTPLSAFALAELARRAGIPKGVFSIVTSTSPPMVGKEFAENPLVRKLSFTGSTPVGKQLMQQCAANVKKLSLELGGNAPFIVFDDADIDHAVEGAIASKFRNAGQTCVCANRIYLQQAIADEFVKKFTRAIQQLKPGSGLEKETTLGPLISESAYRNLCDLLDDALAKGATKIIGGRRIPINKSSYFLEPTVLTHLNDTMRISREEIFGPIAPIFSFDTEEEVIQKANDTPFGLASYFYGRDYARIFRVAEALEYGMVGVNTGLISTTVAPFGGIKESGLGREGSKYGIEEYTELKYICLGNVQ